MKIGDFDPMDRKFWSKNPEPGFSVAKNNYVIESTIKKYEKQRTKKISEFSDKLGERTDAVASYLAGMGGAHRGRSIEKYFGKSYLAYLRGEDIRNQLIKERMMIIGKDKKELHSLKLGQVGIKNSVSQGKGYKLERTKTDEQRSKESKKKV